MPHIIFTQKVVLLSPCSQTIFKNFFGEKVLVSMMHQIYSTQDKLKQLLIQATLAHILPITSEF